MAESKHFFEAIFGNSEIVLMDTNFILSFLGYDSDRAVAKQCETLVYNTVANGCALVYAFRSIEEIKHVVIRGHFESNGYDYDKEFLKKDPARYSRLTREGLEMAQKYLRDIRNCPGVFNEPVGIINSSLCQKADEMMVKYSLKTADSLILASALVEEVDYLATRDTDMAKVDEPNLTVLLDDRSYRQK